jgi:hypothetical protein
MSFIIRDLARTSGARRGRPRTFAGNRTRGRRGAKRFRLRDIFDLAPRVEQLLLAIAHQQDGFLDRRRRRAPGENALAQRCKGFGGDRVLRNPGDGKERGDRSGLPDIVDEGFTRGQVPKRLRREVEDVVFVGGDIYLGRSVTIILAGRVARECRL